MPMTKPCPKCDQRATFAGVIREDPRYPRRPAPEITQHGLPAFGATTIEQPPVATWRGVWRCPNLHES
jgi:hypothetical protein